MATTLQRLLKLADTRYLPDFNARIRDVGALCRTRSDESCTLLEAGMAALGDKKDDWPGLLKAAGANELRDQQTVVEDDAQALTQLLDDALLPAYHQSAAALVKRVREPVATDAVMAIDAADVSQATTSTDDTVVDVPSTSPGASQLQALLSNTLTSMDTGFNTDGVLLSRSFDSRHVPHLRISGRTWPSALATFGPIAIGLLALGLLIGQGLALLRSTRQRTARKLAIARYTEQCMR